MYVCMYVRIPDIGLFNGKITVFQSPDSKGCNYILKTLGANFNILG